MPADSLETPQVAETGFPRNCHFLGLAAGDMRALGRDLGIAVYRQLWRASRGGWQTIPQDLPLADLLDRKPILIRRVVDRFLRSDPQYPILVPTAHDRAWQLQGLPADPNALWQSHHVSTRAALALSAFGPLSQRALALKARLSAAGLRQTPGLWPWCQAWMATCPTVAQALHALMRYDLGIRVQRLEAAVMQRGPAFWMVWTACLPHLKFIDDHISWMRSLVANRDVRLPWNGARRILKVAAEDPESRVGDPEGRAAGKVHSILKIKNIEKDRESMPWRVHAAEQPGGRWHVMTPTTDPNRKIIAKTRKFLLASARYWRFDAAGVDQLLERITDEERLAWKLRHLPRWLEVRQARADWQELRNPAGFILHCLGELPPEQDQLQVFADTCSGNLDPAAWPPLPWEDAMEQALARLSDAERGHLCSLLQTCGIDDPTGTDSLCAVRLGDRYSLSLKRLLGDAAVAQLEQTPPREWCCKYFRAWYVRQTAPRPKAV